MNSTENKSKGRASAVLSRIADRVDLAIDVLTLGQYGLEEASSGDTTRCEGIGMTHRPAGWETRTQRRRGDCEPTPAMSWDWPRDRRDAVSHH